MTTPSQAPVSREEWEKRIGEVVSLLGASEANAKLGRLAQCVDEVDSADAKLLSLVDSIMALQAEVERLREQWDGLYAQLDRDREMGQGYKVSRALFLMKEANEKARQPK